MNKKAYRLVGLVFLVLTLVALPGAAQSAMWVGAELGGNFASSPDIKIDAGGGSATFNSVNVNPSVIGGITIGYDFIKEGFGGYNWPDWMKYFSFATDFTYNRFDMRQQTVDGTIGGFAFQNFQFPKVEGYMAAWTFLFMAHYGFLPDSEVPAGRLHPYLGVGPAVLFSGLDLGNLGGGNHSSVDVALVTEAGLRFMALKNVSLDAAFRYRYAAPTYAFHTGGVATDVSLDAHQFTFLFRASYHF